MSEGVDKMDALVKRLEQASAAYYNTGQQIMSDEEYDELRDSLASLHPNHPFLQTVGAPIKDGCVRLPCPMPSLNKIKPGKGSVENFCANSAVKSWVLSDKLDGISALWIPKGRRMYLRGDGAIGQDISEIARTGIVGLPIHLDAGFMVRGELVLPKSDTPAETIGRSWVNGILHQKTPVRSEVSKIRFVAYEILSDTTHTRAQQMEILRKKGYEVPWFACVNEISDSSLAAYLTERRATGIYDIDGVVVGVNQICLWHAEPQRVVNPKDCVAFKMVLSDQCADTVVKTVHWNLSRQGYYIPCLEIEPVRVGGALISSVTGHNAQVIVEKNLGPGARIRIRRSGDVIPTIEAVLSGADCALPAGATWNGPHLIGGSADDLLESRLRHFAVAIGIEGLGPGLIKKLVDAKITTPSQLCAASPATLSALLGKKTGAQIAEETAKRIAAVKEITLMVASSILPRGVGETKLQNLFSLESDPRVWSQKISRAEGWSEEALAAFFRELPAYFIWREAQFPGRAFTVAAAVAAPVVATRGSICFTGFRSAALEAAAVAQGFQISSTVSNKVSGLLVPDEKEPTGSKVEKARELGIRIWRKSEFMREYSILI
jgi:NAD-dependent DNA ligase